MEEVVLVQSGGNLVVHDMVRGSPPANRNPSALNVGLALKPSVLAAGSAPPVLALSLRLISTVLAPPTT
ncbi:UNVERIFIED_CONTAM: hypothetical protein Sradi_2575100 [Sesamum radiatum]|uniref:Uncharacterized protein n=2 Tax=Sesamum TaxID=4181 RepID=A0AAW2S3I7_SESRA